jgi:hypothetical protein
MNKDKLFADIYVHLHPDCLHDKKDEVEKVLRSSDGVIAVHFDADMDRHALFVSYNPNAVSPEVLLDIIRRSYKRAVRVASIFMTVRSQ